MLTDQGMARITICSPEVQVGNPEFNTAEVLSQVIANDGSQIYLFPELNLTGYTCADLFNQQTLLEAAEQALVSLTTRLNPETFVVVGLPVKHDGGLYNCAAVIHG